MQYVNLGLGVSGAFALAGVWSFVLGMIFHEDKHITDNLFGFGFILLGIGLALMLTVLGLAVIFGVMPLA